MDGRRPASWLRGIGWGILIGFLLSLPGADAGSLGAGVGLPGAGVGPPGEAGREAAAVSGGLWSEAEQIDSLLARVRWDTPAERERRIFAQTHPYLTDAFVPGEFLEFSVRYGPIRAGVATMAIEGIVTVGGDDCFHIVTTARSSDFFSTFFYVNDRVESFVRTRDLLPLRSEKHLIEGDFRDDEVVLFDQRNHVAIYDDGQVVELVDQAHDILSAFYSVRARDLVPGDGFDLNSHVDGKNYPIRVAVHRRERISVPMGDFDCLVVEPKLRTPGLFKHQGELLIWLTDDRRRIPVQMKSKLPIGSVSVVLTDIRGRPER
jgi:hypothetical protein